MTTDPASQGDYEDLVRQSGDGIRREYQRLAGRGIKPAVLQMFHIRSKMAEVLAAADADFAGHAQTTAAPDHCYIVMGLSMNQWAQFWLRQHEEKGFLGTVEIRDYVMTAGEQDLPLLVFPEDGSPILLTVNRSQAERNSG